MSIGRYSSQVLSQNQSLTVTDIIDSKYDDIHSQMYNSAVTKWCSYAGMSIDDVKLFEMRGSYYDTPSKVRVIEKNYPHRKYTVDLTPWWDEYQFKELATDVLADIDGMTQNTLEVVSRDYVKGTAVLESRLTGVRMTVKLQDVPDDMPGAPDDRSIDQTFSYKVEHKIYGR